MVHTVLQRLDTFKTSTGDLPQINAIRGQSQLIEHDVAQFLKRLEKYKDTLGSRSWKCFQHGTLSQRSNGRNAAIPSDTGVYRYCERTALAEG